MRLRRALLISAAILVLAAAALGMATWHALMPLPSTLGASAQPLAASDTHFVAADGTPLNLSFSGTFNRAKVMTLAQMPKLLREAFVASEDQRYWQHGGVDWRARLAALWGNFRAGHIERGASTIGEQVARILKPRPRTYWSHWVAGFDAGRLLRRFGHDRVFAFYLNQVPYAAQRRGVVQAARFYFAREPGALNPAEQLALAVLVRSPQAYDPRQHPEALRRRVDQLAARMLAAQRIRPAQAQAIRRAPIKPGRQSLSVDAGPFVVFATEQARAHGLAAPVLHTTLDANLQSAVQRKLRQRVQALATRGVYNGAALVVDNATGAVLAWAVAPAGGAYAIDPVLTPRQPGSTLKPFVYGLAMAQLGWQADHVLEDSPLAERIETGVHRYRNYSGRHYGQVSVRYALANSLNIPAVRTAQAVGVVAILDLLHQLGFTSLREPADFYGPAIVLGDGAVSLFELVQGYASLARHGQFLPLHVLQDTPQRDPVPVLPAAVSSLLANILSDPNARSAEFGSNSVLDLPLPTAVKTGTSSDYHDIWTVGFDDRYTVGVWMGNLNGTTTDGLTGSLGPAPVLRQIFAHLRQSAPYAGLWLSPALSAVAACEWIGPPPCVQRDEWYLPHSPGIAQNAQAAPMPSPRIARPVPGETLAIDPRIPTSAQRFHFTLDTNGHVIRRVAWQVDGQPLPAANTDSASWVLVTGEHQVSARVWLAEDGAALQLKAVPFTVL